MLGILIPTYGVGELAECSPAVKTGTVGRLDGRCRPTAPAGVAAVAARAKMARLSMGEAGTWVVATASACALSEILIFAGFRKFFGKY